MVPIEVHFDNLVFNLCQCF